MSTAWIAVILYNKLMFPRMSFTILWWSLSWDFKSPKTNSTGLMSTLPFVPVSKCSNIQKQQSQDGRDAKDQHISIVIASGLAYQCLHLAQGTTALASQTCWHVCQQLVLFLYR